MKRVNTRESDEALAAALSYMRSAEANQSELLSLLHEGASLYHGRGAGEAEQLRAYLMVAIAEAGFADALLPFIIEELETGLNPYGLAAASRAARQASVVPESLAELLLRASERISSADQYVSYERYPPPPGSGLTTAIGEIVMTLSLAGAAGHDALVAIRDRAKAGTALSSSVLAGLERSLDDAVRSPCCCSSREPPSETETPPAALSLSGLEHIQLQNQDGEYTTIGAFFSEMASLVAFFYTRCENPNKCSLTISKLGEVIRLTGRMDPAGRVKVAGLSYDPEYDLPSRLRRYGDDRKLPFGDRCQLLRTIGSFDAVRDRLRLGVGYGSSTVNRHRIEILIVDANGRIAGARTRRLWDVWEVAEELLTANVM